MLTALKRVIASEKLFDVQNPTVVICDVELEAALDVKALHVSEIRYYWQRCMQLWACTDFEGFHLPTKHSFRFSL